jgi:arylsulfatase A-like enzyme
MLRQGPWKLVYFSEGHPALLFNMESDPQELVNLADCPNQVKVVEALGGIEAIMAMPSFNYTPLE